MLRGDSHTESRGSGAKAQRGVELQSFAVDAGRDWPAGADFERWRGPLLHALFAAAGRVCSKHGDAEHAGVQARACAGGERATEPVRIVGDEHDRAGPVLATIGTGEAQVKRIPAGAEHRRHRLGDRSELRVAVPLALDRFGIGTERHVVDEHAAVDLGQVHHPLAPVRERVERSHDVVAIDTEIEREMVTRPCRHAHVRESPLRGDRGDDRLRAVAARHAYCIRAVGDRVMHECREVIAEVQLDRLYAARARLACDLEVGVHGVSGV